tara:strand:+ start:1802 stop:2329 length:528 start_codon:yes stop_codon:yes gene_type:complete
MAYLIYDEESGETINQLPYDPTEGGTKPYFAKVFLGEIDQEKDLICAFRPNAAGTALENPYAGKTKEEQTELHRKALNRKAAKLEKDRKLIEIKTWASKLLVDEYSTNSWKHEKATEADLLNGNQDAMTKLAQEKKVIRDANNAHAEVLKGLDPDTDAGADAIIAFDATDFVGKY